MSDNYGFFFLHNCSIFSPNEIRLAAAFFEEVSSVEKGSATVTKFKCQCGTERTQNLKKGYQNLVSPSQMFALFLMLYLKNMTQCH